MCGASTAGAEAAASAEVAGDDLRGGALPGCPWTNGGPRRAPPLVPRFRGLPAAVAVTWRAAACVCPWRAYRPAHKFKHIRMTRSIFLNAGSIFLKTFWQLLHRVQGHAPRGRAHMRAGVECEVAVVVAASVAARSGPVSRGALRCALHSASTSCTVEVQHDQHVCYGATLGASTACKWPAPLRWRMSRIAQLHRGEWERGRAATQRGTCMNSPRCGC